MKTKKQNLDVDFIGGQGALTKSEEDALSAYFKKQKNIHKKSTVGSGNKNKRNSATA
jgi:hypothetical protein